MWIAISLHVIEGVRMSGSGTDGLPTDQSVRSRLTAPSASWKLEESTGMYGLHKSQLTWEMKSPERGCVLRRWFLSEYPDHRKCELSAHEIMRSKEPGQTLIYGNLTVMEMRKKASMNQKLWISFSSKLYSQLRTEKPIWSRAIKKKKLKFPKKQKHVKNRHI